MFELRKEALYIKGKGPNLDKAYSRYKRMRLWAGDAIDVALTEKEAKTLLRLWRKEKYLARKLLVKDVQKLVEFAGHIRVYRGRLKTEKARRRKERSRAKLRKVQKVGKKRKKLKIKVAHKKRFSK